MEQPNKKGWMQNWEEAEDLKIMTPIERAALEAEKVRLLREHEMKQEQALKIESDIELARQYVDTGLWHGALQILKKLLQDPNLTREQDQHVSKLFAEAEIEMKHAAVTHPDEVERFERFNLPIDNVT
jgi:hypothetical protein